VNGAYAEFAEDEKGSIEPGKLADLVVLDRDILALGPDSLPGAKCLMTIVGGRVVYDALETPDR
jgi:predicted amidohydrolase YtcJ